jgi:hypothetical protein
MGCCVVVGFGARAAVDDAFADTDNFEEKSFHKLL